MSIDPDDFLKTRITVSALHVNEEYSHGIYLVPWISDKARLENRIHVLTG